MANLSKNQNKFIRSLARKKARTELGIFLVEGDKMVRELLNPPERSIPYKVKSVVATGDWLDEFRESIPGGIEILETTAAELRQVSLQQEPNRAMAMVHQNSNSAKTNQLGEALIMGLENIQDPGNMGAIIRIADWFGIRDILCSHDCVELYNPKVIQSTMGSFLRVRVHYVDLMEFIGEILKDKELPVFATGGEGNNLHETILPEKGLILLGNESRGLSDSLMALSGQVLSIPFHDPSMHPESLNVAAAAAILCAEFRRQGYSK